MNFSMPQSSASLLNLTFPNICLLHVFSFSMVVFALCINQLFSIRSLRGFLVHGNTKAKKSAWHSFLLSSATANNSVTRSMLIFTINWLISNFGRSFDLLFKLDEFLRGGSEVIFVRILISPKFWLLQNLFLPKFIGKPLFCFAVTSMEMNIGNWIIVL